MSSLVFFGSGPVAAKSLELLSKHQHIEAVVTKPRPPHHRGEMPVLATSEKLGLAIFTPANKLELSKFFSEAHFTSRLGVVIDYGIIIAKDVLDCFELGIVNSHFSLLPRWRGADPISFAILEGDKKTGVSLMVIDEHLDTGKLITQKGIPIDDADTTPTLTNKLVLLSDELLADYLPRYKSGEIKPHAQPHPNRATYSRKLTKDDGIIDWHKPAERIEREVRAFSGWPRSHTVLAEKDVTITKALVLPDKGEPGIIKIIKNQLVVHCGENALEILSLQPAGRNEVTAQEFLAGHRSLFI